VVFLTLDPSSSFKSVTWSVNNQKVLLDQAGINLRRVAVDAVALQRALSGMDLFPDSTLAGLFNMSV